MPVIEFTPLGNAVDSAQVQSVLGLSRAHLHRLVTKTYDIGMGAALPRPAGQLGGAMVWDVRELEKALPSFLAARRAAASRRFERVEREPLDVDELAGRRETFQGLPHILGFMDAVMISEHFGLGDGGPRKVWEWSQRGHLLPEESGTLGGRHVWDVREVKEREPLILSHLERRRSLPVRK